MISRVQEPVVDHEDVLRVLTVQVVDAALRLPRREDRAIDHAHREIAGDRLELFIPHEVRAALLVDAERVNAAAAHDDADAQRLVVFVQLVLDDVQLLRLPPQLVAVGRHPRSRENSPPSCRTEASRADDQSEAEQARRHRWARGRHTPEIGSYIRICSYKPRFGQAGRAALGVCLHSLCGAVVVSQCPRTKRIPMAPSRPTKTQRRPV